MVTIKDIAQETGFSPATVARALSGSGPARDETRRRVVEVADRLGYVVSDAARAMRGQSSNIVGLMVPDITNRFYSQMANEIGKACAAEGLHLLLSITNDDPEQELRMMRSMVAARAGAVALVPAPNTAPGLLALATRQPFVQLVRRSAVLESRWFGFEEVPAFRRVTKHLIDLGHRRIGLICSDEGFSTGESRYQGYVEGFKARGLQHDPGLVMRGPASLAFGQKAMHELLPDVTAVIAAGSLLTEGAVEEIGREAVSVPDTLSFVGFGIEYWHVWWAGGMTRIVPPVEDLSQACARQLLEYFTRKEPSTGRETFTLNQLKFFDGSTCQGLSSKGAV